MKPIVLQSNEINKTLELNPEDLLTNNTKEGFDECLLVYQNELETFH